MNGDRPSFWLADPPWLVIEEPILGAGQGDVQQAALLFQVEVRRWLALAQELDREEVAARRRSWATRARPGRAR